MVCEECKTVLEDKIYCNACANKLFTSQPDQPAPAASEPVAAASTPADTGNTSGQGSLAIVPQEILGWNWGAFTLNLIWSIFNNVWIGLLMLVPGVNFVMWFVLGAKGNEWAWKNKRWDSVEHFKRTQSTWAKVGIILWLAGIVFYILIFAITCAVGMSGY